MNAKNSKSNCARPPADQRLPARRSAPRSPTSKSRLQDVASAGCGGFFGLVFLVLWWDVRKQRINSHGRPLPRSGPDRGRHRAPPAAESCPAGPPRQTPSQVAEPPWIMPSIPSPPGCSCERTRKAFAWCMVSSATRAKARPRWPSNWQRGSPARASPPCSWITICGGRRSTASSACPRGPGVSECLQKQCEVSQVVHPTDAENLSVITAGDSLPDLLGPLANGVTTAFFEKARAAFTFVVVDGSPILPVIDGLLVEPARRHRGAFRPPRYERGPRSAACLREAFRLRIAEVCRRAQRQPGRR